MNNLRTTWRGWMGRRWVRQSGRKGRCSYLEPWWTPIRLQPLVPQSSLLLSIIVNISSTSQLQYVVCVLWYWFKGFSEISLEDSNFKVETYCNNWNDKNTFIVLLECSSQINFIYCVTQLKLYTVDKLSSTIFCCLYVRHWCHPTKYPLFPIYTGIQALCWPCTT